MSFGTFHNVRPYRLFRKQEKVDEPSEEIDEPVENVELEPELESKQNWRGASRENDQQRQIT